MVLYCGLIIIVVFFDDLVFGYVVNFIVVIFFCDLDEFFLLNMNEKWMEVLKELFCLEMVIFWVMESVWIIIFGNLVFLGFMCIFVVEILGLIF